MQRIGRMQEQRQTARDAQCAMRLAQVHYNGAVECLNACDTRPTAVVGVRASTVSRRTAKKQ